MTIRKHNDGWRKISLDPAPEGRPMRRIELDADLNPKPRWSKRDEERMKRALRAQGYTYLQIEDALHLAKSTPRATPAPRSIYDEPWLRRILDGTWQQKP